MSWWKRLWRGGTVLSSPELLHLVRLTMQEWSEEPSSDNLRVWRDPQGDVLSLSVPDAYLGQPGVSDETALQRWARSLAESRRAGLIEVRLFTGTLGAAVGLIYKRLQMPMYIFTAELMNAGKLTIEDYERSCALDPYDPKYRGVDRSVLRFISDDERYDGLFPEHPLSKVRRVLAMLPYSVQVESQAPIEIT